MKRITIDYNPKTADNGQRIDLYEYLRNEFENDGIRVKITERNAPPKRWNNVARVVTAKYALEIWREFRGETPGESDIRDLMTDLLHLMMHEGRDMAAELRMMRNAFEAEIAAKREG